jgi:hypothetical protein
VTEAPDTFDDGALQRLESLLLRSPDLLVSDLQLRRAAQGCGRPLPLGTLQPLVRRLADEMRAQGRGALVRVPDTGWVYRGRPEPGVPHPRPAGRGRVGRLWPGPGRQDVVRTPADGIKKPSSQTEMPAFRTLT